ncbi:hypothetical protein MANES_13G149300v8 [Manihot esculenta]|uniref:Cell wall protein n=1 Tax=Manihot esculenta TaxID=3983 RepID=A0A2C9UTD5_MANES|nr:hypothetical protein MANES_13G149300v8 [Manihot esculenta]
MAHTSKLYLITLLVLFAISRQALAGRRVPMKSNQSPQDSKDVNLKQSDFLFKYHHPRADDHSFLIPGIGRVLAPPAFSVPSHSPYTGTGGSGPGTGGYVPGGDDTFIPNPFVPNPGYEVPNPGSAGPVTPAAHP